ncbi:DsrE family protein [Tropicimonas sediminicola]|uniref:Sulfur relay (Sulfurtransferase) complex TusBCD TusD component, DsrE family n=1 Tax=Tropicimonas sediminicola TaxID=1031541 RepID=A0A239H2A5_9RHOB|nr:DsrE family protein [Tropicimonas sediminicola]SNS75606.1 Sulfur relay (sulfurtransferase) complex TusBCD TusD component, DsrE family [Tropicimonas sediminicola]
MSLLRNLFAGVALALFGAAALAEDGKPGLFVNLTTDDTWAAAKAIMFAHEKALKNGHEPVAIWLNVRAVYLADRKRSSHIPGPMAGDGTSIQDMLTAFMADGGTVIMCSACSQAAGLTEADYIDGVEMGNWPVVESILFDPDVKTLSW